MNRQTALILGLALVCSILLIGASSVQALTSSQVKTAVTNAIDKQVNSDWSHIKLVIIREAGKARVTVYNTTSVTPPPPIVCPTGQHLENGVCVPDVIPPPPPSGVIPALDTSKSIRIGALGDIDNNAGLTKQLDLAVKYQVQYLVIPGDFEYSSGSGVLDKIKAHGFSGSNTILAVGNHDSCNDVKAFVGECYGGTFAGNGYMQFIVINANSGFGCSGSQYDTVKGAIESSDAWYNIAVVHQPFVTVKSDHGPNGQFSCFHSLFKANGVNLVLQAHNHNYQKEIVDNIPYLVVGTGTHDTGSSMYPCSSSSDQNGVPAKCITGTNGITIMDFQINDPNTRHIDSWFLSNAEKVTDSFSK